MKIKKPGFKKGEHSIVKARFLGSLFFNITITAAFISAIDSIIEDKTLKAALTEFCVIAYIIFFVSWILLAYIPIARNNKYF